MLLGGGTSHPNSFVPGMLLNSFFYEKKRSKLFPIGQLDSRTTNDS